MQLSDIVAQYDKSTSSSMHWCRARASTAPVVNHEHLASFKTLKLVQYKIIGCKHLADKLEHWLRLRLVKFWFWRNIGINSKSRILEQRLRLSTVNFLHVVPNTCKKNHFLTLTVNDLDIIQVIQRFRSDLR